MSFASEIEWGPFKYLFCKDNDSIVKLIVSTTSGVSLWYRRLLKYVKLWQRLQMPKDYKNTKVDFLWPKDYNNIKVDFLWL